MPANDWRRLLFSVTMLFILHVAAVRHPARSQPPASDEQVQQALTAGEFGFAKKVSQQQLPTEAKAAVLGQIAVAQSLSGDPNAASSTLRGISQADQRRQAISQTRSAAMGSGVAGGGTMADFQSLMTLIETTVVPDTWEALGGNSTMAPYPQGVCVDPAGTLIDSPARDRLVADEVRGRIDDLLAADTPIAGPADWRQATALRCVSLRRLRDAIAAKRLFGQPLGDELLHLAGLSHVRYVMLTDDDVILAAPVGGIEQHQGWYVDRQSGRSTLRSDFLARCLTSAIGGVPFGCTIDPTADGMRAAAGVASEIQSGDTPIGSAATSLRDALGMQRIEVFGAAADTAVALLMVEADRHMKELALGRQPLPEGIDNYLDIVDKTIASGPPSGLLLRLWFTSNKQHVRADSSRRVFEISGDPIRLSAENQRALADGRRGEVTIDPRSEAFVAGFNQNWEAIRDDYPIYGGLESLFHTAAAAELIARHGEETAHREVAETLSFEDEARDWPIIAPRQVPSIAVLHRVRHRKQVHHILMASGGVLIIPRESVAKAEVYPALDGVDRMVSLRPITVQRWWWNAR